MRMINIILINLLAVAASHASESSEATNFIQADIHAAILLSLIPSAALLIWVKKETWSNESLQLGTDSTVGIIVYRIGRGFFVFMLSFLTAFFLSAVVLHLNCKCGAGNNPFSQLWIPTLTSGLIAVFYSSTKKNLTAAAIFLVVALILSSHFHKLVLTSESCLYTGDPEYINSCDRPAVAVKLWHTWFTGIYGLHLK